MVFANEQTSLIKEAFFIFLAIAISAFFAIFQAGFDEWKKGHGRPQAVSRIEQKVLKIRVQSEHDARETWRHGSSHPVLVAFRDQL